MVLRLAALAAAVPVALAARPVYNTLDDDTFITRGGKSSGATINYAGYVAATDVRSHASIDCDQRALEDCYDNYAGSDYFDGTYSDMFTCAEAIYRTGQAAGTCNLKSSRTLRGFSLQVEAKMSKFNAPNFGALDKFVAYYGNYTYANQFVMNAITGGGDVWGALGDTFDAGASSTSAARWQAVKKGTAYINVPMYALYEYFRRANYAVNPNYNDSPKDKAYSHVHGWDEGWAFWAGKEARKCDSYPADDDDADDDSYDGCTRDDIASSDGYLMFNLAEKRDGSFKTNKGPNPSGAQSMVNYKILAASQIGRDRLMNFTGLVDYTTSVGGLDGEYVYKAYKCIENQAFIPMIQGCLLYAYKSDKDYGLYTDYGKAIGEMYTFCAAMIPLVANVSSTAAATIMTHATPTAEAMRTNYTTVRDALYPLLNDMGYKCSDIGVVKDDPTYSSVADLPQGWCKDSMVVDYCGMAVPYDEYDTDADSCSSSSNSKHDKGSRAVAAVGGVMMLLGAGLACFGLHKFNQAKTAGGKVPTTEMSSV